MTDEPHIPYFNMGQWPLFVGFTTSRKAFAREVKRLGNPTVKFLASDHSSATMHTFVEDGSTVCIIAMEKPAGRSNEQVAGMIAHEAVHVAQELWARIGEREPGREAEAYLVQMIVQCCLQEAWKTGRVRKDRP